GRGGVGFAGLAVLGVFGFSGGRFSVPWVYRSSVSRVAAFGGGGQGGSSAAARGSSPRPGPPHRRSRPLSIAYPPAGRCVVIQSGEARSLRWREGGASG